MFYDEKERWVACVHEAAHAVIASLGGAGVYEIAVAPVGSGKWDGDYDEHDKSVSHLVREGYCRTSNVGVEVGFSRWDSDENLYRVAVPNFPGSCASIFLDARGMSFGVSFARGFAPSWLVRLQKKFCGIQTSPAWCRSIRQRWKVPMTISTRRCEPPNFCLDARRVGGSWT